MTKQSPLERYEAVVAALRTGKKHLVQTHNNPDPDSMACAMALRLLVQRETGRDAVIAFGGVVGRSENRAMVRQLAIPLVPGSLVDYAAYDCVAVCDTQPGTNYTSFPDWLVPSIVIDHHAMRPETKKARVAIVEPSYGATSTIVAEMLFAGGVPMPTDLATALYYAIRAETQDLARDATELDIDVYRRLEPLMDRRVLSRIETGRVPREHFDEVRRAIVNAQVHGDVVVTDLGQLRVPDIVAEMADFMLRLESARWTCVMGEYRQTLYVSLRTSDVDGDAGDVMRRVISGMGSGGGHPSMAGGQVPLAGFTAEEKEAARGAYISEFLRLAGAGDVQPEPLVEPM